MFLQVEDQQLPVSSSILIVHSQVIGAMIVEEKKNAALEGNSPLVICLDAENRRDIELLLEFLYYTRTRIYTVGVNGEIHFVNESSELHGIDLLLAGAGFRNLHPDAFI